MPVPPNNGCTRIAELRSGGRRLASLGLAVGAKALVCFLAGGAVVCVGAAYLASVFIWRLVKPVTHQPPESWYIVGEALKPAFVALAFLAPMGVVWLLKRWRRVSRRVSVLRLGFGAALGGIAAGVAVAGLVELGVAWSTGFRELFVLLFASAIGLIILGLSVWLGGALGACIGSAGRPVIAAGGTREAQGGAHSEPGSQQSHGRA